MEKAVIDKYIDNCPKEVQEILREVRKVIRESVPEETTEKISYQMPTFYYHGNLVHFAALKNHVGFYPTPSGVIAFEAETNAYKSTKGAIQFPYDKPIPYELIRKIVKFRVQENLEKETTKKKRKNE